MKSFQSFSNVTWPGLTGSIGELREFNPSCRSCFPVLLMHFVFEKPNSLDFIFWMLCSVCHLKWLPSFAFRFWLHIPEMSMTKDLPVLVSVTTNLCAKGPNLLAKGPDFRHICIAFAISCFFEVSKPPGNSTSKGGLMTHLVDSRAFDDHV